MNKIILVKNKFGPIFATSMMIMKHTKRTKKPL